MSVDVQPLFDAFEDLREKANVNAVFGEPVTVGERTVIPVAQVSYGFGLGFGEGVAPEQEEEAPEGEGAGAGVRGGGGAVARPIAVVEVTDEGTWVEPVVDEQKVALAGILLTAWAVFWLSRALVRIFGRKS